jgi:hypothetical protein
MQSRLERWSHTCTLRSKTRRKLTALARTISAIRLKLDEIIDDIEVSAE